MMCVEGRNIPMVHLLAHIIRLNLHGKQMGKQWKQWQTIFLGSKITAEGDCTRETKRCLLFGRKAMTNLDSILTTRVITLLTKVCLVKAMVPPVVMHGCERWTIKKAEHWRMDVFELWCCRKLLSVPWNARSNQWILKEICPEYSLEVSESHSVVSDSLQPHGLYSPWNSPGHNTGVGSLSLLQGIFPTQGSNPGLPYCRQILYQLSHSTDAKVEAPVLWPPDVMKKRF